MTSLSIRGPGKGSSLEGEDGSSLTQENSIEGSASVVKLSVAGTDLREENSQPNMSRDFASIVMHPVSVKLKLRPERTPYQTSNQMSTFIRELYGGGLFDWLGLQTLKKSNSLDIQFRKFRLQNVPLSEHEDYIEKSIPISFCDDDKYLECTEYLESQLDDCLRNVELLDWELKLNSDGDQLFHDSSFNMSKGFASGISKYNFSNSITEIDEIDPFENRFSSPEIEKSSLVYNPSSKSTSYLNYKHHPVRFQLKRFRNTFQPLKFNFISDSSFEFRDSLISDENSEYGRLKNSDNSSALFLDDLETSIDDVLYSYNALNTTSWMSEIVWDDSDNHDENSHSKAVLDLNDDQLLFENISIFQTETPSLATTGDKPSSFNISRDQSSIYTQDPSGGFIGKSGLQHASFAKELDFSVFEIQRHPDTLLKFHRPVSSLMNLRDCMTIRSSSGVKYSKVSEQVALGKKFVPKRPKDLSAKEGDLILLEYIEETPLVMVNSGMASELIVYYRKKSTSDTTTISTQHGIITVIPYDADEESNFLGKVPRGKTVPSINNNLFSTPIFEHVMKSTDFLLVKPFEKEIRGLKKKRHWYIRQLPPLFVTGQIFPKMEVPAPNSKLAGEFIRNRLLVHILRLFKQRDILRLSEVTSVFPFLTDAYIRQRMKGIAEFTRGAADGGDSNIWRLNPDYVPPSDLELMELVTPEQVCCYQSMEAAQARLCSIGITLMNTSTQLHQFLKKMDRLSSGGLFKLAQFIDQELKLCPWELTSNYLTAVQGKGLLKLLGPGNPLNPREGFSFFRMSHRAESRTGSSKEEVLQVPEKEKLTGTDKDLRKLTIQELKAALREFEVSETIISSLDRWGLVKKLREKSNEAVRSGQSTAFDKFSRNERSTFQHLRSKFTLNAQQTFERHCEVLSSKEPHIPTDESEEALDSDDEVERWTQDLESAIITKSGDDLLTQPTEKSEVKADQPKHDAQSTQSLKPDEKKDSSRSSSKAVVKQKFIRKTTVRYNEDGSIVEEQHIIQDVKLIEAFELDQADQGTRFISLMGEYSTAAKPYLMRSLVPSSRAPRKKKKFNGASKRKFLQRSLQSPKEEKPKKMLNVTCGACGQVGHMRLSRNCPFYGKEAPRLTKSQKSKRSIFSEASTPTHDLSPDPSDFSMNDYDRSDVNGNIVLKLAPVCDSKVATMPLILKAPKQSKKTSIKKRKDAPSESIEPKQKRGAHSIQHRTRGDPLRNMNVIYHGILEALLQMSKYDLFYYSVSEKVAPGYSSVVKTPMYLDLMRRRAGHGDYGSIKHFLEDLELIAKNSEAYNGVNSPITKLAADMVSHAKSQLEPVSLSIIPFHYMSILTVFIANVRAEGF